MKALIVLALIVPLAGCTFSNLMRAVSDTDFKGTTTQPQKEDDE